MNKLPLIFICVMFLLSGGAQGQTNNYPSTGNIGLGTNVPLAGTNNNGIHLSKGGHSTILLGDPISNGYGGVLQTSDDRHRIFIGANLYDDIQQSWRNFVPGKGGAGISVVADKGGWGSSVGFYVSDEDNEVYQAMVIKNKGNIGIGTETPNEKLAVNGNIRAKEIKVEATNWPDYVFKSDYTLMPLKEVEQHIKTHGHLPDIPKAEQIEQDGLSVSEMNKLMMKKIEELTLHLIEKDKRISELELLNKRFEKLEQRINAMEGSKN